MSQPFPSSGQSIGASASASVFAVNIQDWFLLRFIGLISLQSKGLKNLLQHHSLKALILQHWAFFMVQLSHPCMTTGKMISLCIWTFASKVMSLVFNMLSRFIIGFLPRRKYLLISWLQSTSKKIKSVTAYTFPLSICHNVMGLDVMILVFWMLSFKAAFSLLFHFHQEAR